jgi:hypothetical protein
LYIVVFELFDLVIVLVLWNVFFLFIERWLIYVVESCK